MCGCHLLPSHCKYEKYNSVEYNVWMDDQIFVHHKTNVEQEEEFSPSTLCVREFSSLLWYFSQV